MTGYSVGTITVTQGRTTVFGNGTTWFTEIPDGGLLTIDGVRYYQIDTVVDDTTLVLAVEYPGTTLIGTAYAIQQFNVSIPYLTQIDLRDYAPCNSFDNPIDSEMARWIADCKRNNATGVGVGNICTEYTVWAPPLDQPGNNSAIANTYNFVMGGGGEGNPVLFQWYYAGTSGYGWDDPMIAANLPGVRMYPQFVGVRMFGSMGPGYSTAAGGFRFANWRHGKIGVMADSFRKGAGITCWGMNQGDFQYSRHVACQSGWWPLNAAVTPPVSKVPMLGVNDYQWNFYGFRMIGNKDDNGATAETNTIAGAVYNCQFGYISEGYPSDTPPVQGIPNTSQHKYLGGAGYNRSSMLSLQSYQMSELWVGVVGAGSTATTLVLGAPSGQFGYGQNIDGYFIDPSNTTPIFAMIESGPCAGQYAVFTAYVGATATGTLYGRWQNGVPPNPGDQIIMSYMPVGFRFDSGGGGDHRQFKCEGVIIPVSIGANTALIRSSGGNSSSADLTLDPTVVVNSHGNGAVIEGSQGPFPVTAVNGMTITLSGACDLGYWYCRNGGQTFQAVAGTGSNIIDSGGNLTNIKIRIEGLSGWTGWPNYQMTPTAPGWEYTAWDAVTQAPIGVAPDTTTVFQAVMGAVPLFLSSQLRVIDNAWDATVNQNSGQILPDGLSMVSRYTTPPNGSGAIVGTPDTNQPVNVTQPAINGTGNWLTAGDIVKIESSGYALTYGNTGGDAAGCCIVGGMFPTQTYAPLQPFPRVVSGTARVSMASFSGGSNPPGSIISANGNMGQVAGSPTTPETYIASLVGSVAQLSGTTATGTATFAGNIMTVTGTTGSWALDQVVTGSGLPAGLCIINPLTFVSVSGGDGTYFMNIAVTTSSVAVSGQPKFQALVVV